eukprot:CAMPEP_0198142290 /NCGR_PEP_ID=MMETSP1443-20131203/5117_1 /TAXON_ID=186043 /ORGANISM="Entomoneis sp., Strain CCMP2396" /LENGTH=363 /DNA_ID=CAMNT_0043805261 /DNA_START=317 /DNA_END=1405 /DNA_ORIENTATION=-
MASRRSQQSLLSQPLRPSSSIASTPHQRRNVLRLFAGTDDGGGDTVSSKLDLRRNGANLFQELDSRRMDKTEIETGKKLKETETIPINRKSNTASRRSEPSLLPQYFDSDPRETQWQNRYDELVEYHGDCLVTKKDKENPALGFWMMTQRKQYKRFKEMKSTGMNQDRIDKLESLGFDWDPFGSLWTKRYQELEKYKNEKGDCLVSQKFKENSELGKWVSRQRHQYNRMKENKSTGMTQSRIDRLESLGFDWDPQGSLWTKRYQQLEKYKDGNGDCLVPKKYIDNPALGEWVNTQRSQYQRFKENKASRMTQDRIDMMESLGFDWDPLESIWNERFEELRQYVYVHGPGSIPSQKNNPRLHVW